MAIPPGITMRWAFVVALLFSEAIGLTALLNLAAVARAQVYPLTVTVAWDHPADEEEVTKHTITHNGVSVDQSIAYCSATECTKQLTITSSALQTVSITATNAWGTSLPATIQFTASAPGKSTNIRIRVP